MVMKLRPVKIISNKRLSDDSYLLSFDGFFSFRAGQSVAVSLKNIAPRLYSICSAQNSPTIEILYKIAAGGTLTPLLAKLKKGDTLLVSEPMGSFFHTSQLGFWIASGTGIAPFISMLKSDVPLPVNLIHGVSTGKHLYFSDYLTQKLGSRYIPCVSREPESRFYNGRVSKWIAEWNELPRDIKYYLCGRPEMVVETRDLLIEKGIPFGNILSEIYF